MERRMICPFCHKDLLIVDTDKKIYTCFSCFKSGTKADWETNIKRISHKTYLKQNPSEDWVPSISKERLLEINGYALKYFKRCLNKCTKAQDYLVKRGFKDTNFEFGYAPAPNKKFTLLTILKEKGYSDEEILESGLGYLKDDKTIEPFFRKRVIIPIKDETNNIVGFGGRVLDDSKPKYLNTKENSIFQKRDILFGLNKAIESKSDTVYFVEGYMDVLSLNKNGIFNAVAALGTAIGKHHCSLLRENGIKKIVLSLDRDEAGIKASLKASSILIEEGFDVDILCWENAKDPDEFIERWGKEAYLSAPVYSVDEFKVKYSDNKINAVVDVLLSM